LARLARPKSANSVTLHRSKYGEIRHSKSAIGQPHADPLQSLHGSPNTCGQAAFGFNGFCLWHTVAIGNRISVMRRSPGRSRIVSERSLVSIRPARRNADSTRLTWIAPDQVAEILEACHLRIERAQVCRQCDHVVVVELFDHLLHQLDPRALTIADLHVVELAEDNATGIDAGGRGGDGCRWSEPLPLPI
jgi:hypothetical protein